MKTFLSVKILRKFGPLFDKLGIEYDKLERIITLKLIMDSRKTTVLSQNQSKRTGKIRYDDFMNLFIGLMLSMLMASNTLPIFYSMTMVLGTIFLYAVFYILADFSVVILDLRDKIIIGSTPIKEKTLHMAKMIHITIYLSRIMVELCIFPLLATLFFKGPICVVILIIEVIMMALLSLFFTNVAYYVLISLCSGEKLKDIINCIQAAFMIVVIVMQQLLPRLFQFSDGNMTYSFHWWYYLVPPFWMSAPIEILTNGVTHPGFVGLSVCSIVLPCVLFVIYVEKMSPYFESKLTKMNNGEGKKEKKKSKASLNEWIGKRICKDSREYRYYCFTNQMVATERKYKLQVYPQLALGIIFPFVFCLIAIDFDDPTSWLTQIRQSQFFFFTYFTSMCASQCLVLTSKSENYKAAWVYKMLPIASEELLYKGLVKAVAVKYLFPLIVYQSLFMLCIWGFRIWPYVLVIGINACTIYMVYYRMMDKEVPFSKGYDSEGERNTGKMMGASFILLGIAGGHYFISLTQYGNAVMGILSLVVVIYLYRTSFKKEKKGMEKVEQKYSTY